MIRRRVQHGIGVHAVKILTGGGLVRGEVGVIGAVDIPVGRGSDGPINVVVEREVGCGLDQIGHSGVDDVVFEKIGIAAAVGGNETRVESRAGRSGIPIKGVVVNLYAVEGAADAVGRVIHEDLPRIGAVYQLRIIRAYVIADDVVGADHIVGGKHGDAVSDGIMSVVVLDDIVVVPDVYVIVATIPRTKVLNI